MFQAKNKLVQNEHTHFHPSGDTLPSQEDIAITRKLVEAGKLLDITILDHIIIGKGKFESLKERGIL
ncbi:JAB domain-containing protein [Pectinatus frisingensis]|uniref:JAB domain-containing protein n=1 Tax=Pectinatus frisingensis TaxID=865 RepID=UPI0018C69A98